MDIVGEFKKKIPEFMSVLKINYETFFKEYFFI